MSKGHTKMGTTQMRNGRIRPAGSGVVAWLEAAVHRARPLLHGIVGVAVLAISRPSELTSIIGFAVVLVAALARAWIMGFIDKDEHLCTEGPYGLVRHPLYLANFLVFIGICVAANTATATWLLVISMAVVYFFTVRHEERQLRRRFGVTYEQYAARVPAIIPRLRNGGLRIRTGGLPLPPLFVWQTYALLIFAALFGAKYGALQLIYGIAYPPVWGLAVPQIIGLQ